MQGIVRKTFNAVRKQIDPNRRKNCFELFGYDFILDEDFNLWLIEVNTNPCLEESSSLLKMLLPRMIEDMLQLTVDKLFKREDLLKHRKKLRKQSVEQPQVSTRSAAEGAPQTPPAALNPQSELAMISEAKDECMQSPTEVNSRNVSDNDEAGPVDP